MRNKAIGTLPLATSGGCGLAPDNSALAERLVVENACAEWLINLEHWWWAIFNKIYLFYKNSNFFKNLIDNRKNVCYNALNR